MKVPGNFHTLGSRVATEISSQELVRFDVKETPGSDIASKRTAKSYTDLVIGPAVSKSSDAGTIPSWGTKPMVGLIV